MPLLLLVIPAFAGMTSKSGSLSPNPESRIPNPESRIPNPESRIPNPESRIPNPESRIPMAFLHPIDIAEANALRKGTLIEHLGIVITAAGEDWLRATMPVDARTRQPYGLLHGGASAALAETLGSMAGGYCVDPATHGVVGIEINANHLRAVREGTVTGTARALHVGRSTQVWEIRIEDEAGRPVCVSRLTLAVVARK